MAEEYMSGKDMEMEMVETERCVMTLFQKTDYDEVKQLYRNQEVRRYLGGIRTEEDLQLVLEEMLHMRKEYHWVIRKKDSKKFIGFISLGSHHDGSFHEVSYQLLPKWWRNGYGTEAVHAILEYVFNVLNLPKVIAETQTLNKPSRKLLERVGMREERRVIRFGAEQIIYSIASE